MKTDIQLEREVDIDVEVASHFYRPPPARGPRLLFFSGGTALNLFSEQLKHYTHNSIHLVTTFDSGGSSAKLRDALQMPAIGDLRSRLMALSDKSKPTVAEIYPLFAYRFPRGKSQAELWQLLLRIASAQHPLISTIRQPTQALICELLNCFINAVNETFDLKHASLGNLILAGGYICQDYQLAPVIKQFSQLVNAKGTVLAVNEDNLHLWARLKDQKMILGQHRLTGKEHPAISSAIDQIGLTTNLQNVTESKCTLSPQLKQQIEAADLICYPMGSYYSSLVAALLPEGTAQSIANNSCAKVYIPNLGADPEQLDMCLEKQILKLIEVLQKQSPDTPVSKLLNFLLVDSRNLSYPGGIPRDLLAQHQIVCIDTDLLDPINPQQYDNHKLASALLSLA